MKKIVLLIIMLATAFAGKGQNLVPNGDFEQFSNCPDGSGDLNYCLYWINPSTSLWNGTPDYFNDCSFVNNFDVPNNYYGFQSAHSGVGYCGIVAGRVDSNFNNWREYAEIQLTSPLIANTCYYFEMYMSLANESWYTSEEMGVYFSGNLISGNFGWQHLPYTPQLNLNLGFFTDTLNWIKVYGNYTPATAINYLTIGNFYDSSQTTTHLINPNGTFDYSFFYIDDVSLTPCTGIEELNNIEAITIFPNPAKEYFGLRFSDFGFNKKYELRIIDILGKEVLKAAINNPQSDINIKSFQKGIYFIEINNGKTVYRKKLVKE